MILILGVAIFDQGTFVQGDKYPRDSCPRRPLSKEAFSIDKLAQINFSLFSIGYYDIY